MPRRESNFDAKSKTAKEIAAIAKNRDERRQRLAEEKAHKESLMIQENGNPCWEFAAMIKEFKQNIEFRPLKSGDPVVENQITVCVRKRPLNQKEENRKELDVISVPTRDQLIVHEPKQKVDLTKYLENQQFRFDYVFDEKCSNETVYKFTAKPLVKSIFDGGKQLEFLCNQSRCKP